MLCRRSTTAPHWGGISMVSTGDSSPLPCSSGQRNALSFMGIQRQISQNDHILCNSLCILCPDNLDRVLRLATDRSTRHRMHSSEYRPRIISPRDCRVAEIAAVRQQSHRTFYPGRPARLLRRSMNPIRDEVFATHRRSLRCQSGRRLSPSLHPARAGLPLTAQSSAPGCSPRLQ
jgi:hypothetical protein